MLNLFLQCLERGKALFIPQFLPEMHSEAATVEWLIEIEQMDLQQRDLSMDGGSGTEIGNAR